MIYCTVFLKIFLPYPEWRQKTKNYAMSPVALILNFWILAVIPLEALTCLKYTCEASQSAPLRTTEITSSLPCLLLPRCVSVLVCADIQVILSVWRENICNIPPELFVL